ncbi:DNA polymerase III subunit gamma/tau [bacterium]|nr:DNA polymerase III subunit gamma/tau [bacterium]
MSYLVLARKYRPQKFEEVIGQTHIARVLKNSIASKRIAHAFLFSGSRGVGKTTMARILAKAVNCKKGPTPQPCTECTSCREIAEGRSLDVLEIDGASNRGIDEIRSLKENVKFAPSGNKYKVYIIDEVHMLTTDAFNALLKTLEEPPGHVIFILATTEPHKIPATILSRCQRFNFKLLSFNEIKKHLEYIVDKEKILIEQSALSLVAKQGAGSLRDALSVFEQVISLEGEEKKEEDIIALLGILPDEILSKFFDLIAGNSSRELLSFLKEIVNSGYDVHQLNAELKQYFRDLLMAKIAGEESVLFTEKSDKERENLNKRKEGFSIERFLFIIELLSAAQERMKWSEDPQLVLEITLIKLSRPYVGIDEIINKISVLQREVSEISGETSETDENSEEEKKCSFEEEKKETLKIKKTENTATEAEFSNTGWDEILKEINLQKQSVGVFLSRAKIRKKAEGNNYVFEFSKEDMFYLKGIEKNSKMIVKVIEKVTGKKAKITCILNEKKADSSLLPEEKKEKEEIHPYTQKVIDMFDGRIMNGAN